MPLPLLLRRLRPALLAPFLLLLLPAARAQTVTVEKPRLLSVVRVNVTNQPYDFSKPWGKKTPYTRRAIGAILPEGRVLVTGELVANANYVELESPDGSRKVPASVEAVDYEANVAVLRAGDPDFLSPAAFAPLQLTTAAVGDTLSVWQLENNGNLLVTRGLMTTAEVKPYPTDDSPFLIYRCTSTLQGRENSYTVPLVKGDQLVGMLARYDAQSTNIDIIPAPVIEHFLRDLQQPPYQGFPRAGMSFANTRDPQLRRYVGLQGRPVGGVYVTEVLASGPAGQAGLKVGDVLISIDDQPLDQDGNFRDPDYGRIAVGHLLSTRHYAGDVVKFSILRAGQPQELEVKLAHRPPQDYVVDPYLIDHPPKFLILGGLVLQELSRPYLREWGPDWVKKAPEELSLYDRQQLELFNGAEPGRKVVFLSRVLPTDASIGYEDLHHLVVTRVNGQEIHSLANVQEAIGKFRDGRHKIEFESDPAMIFLDVEQAKTSEGILTQTYRLPTLRQLE